MKSKGFKTFSSVIIIILIATLIFSSVAILGQIATPVAQNQPDVNNTTPAETTNNFETYSSAEFKYSFQYPKDLILTKSPYLNSDESEVIFISKEKLLEGTEPNSELSISVDKSSLEDHIRENLISREEITFAGIPATKIKYTGDYKPEVFLILVPRNEYVFVISYDAEKENDSSIEKILNSFSFTK